MNIERKKDIIYLSGVIDENSDFSPLLLEVAPLRLDFKGIQRINSIGVRSWLRFLTQWNDKPMEYHNCPPVIVDQLEIIGALRGIRKRAAFVASAWLPAECAHCRKEIEVLATHKDYDLDSTLQICQKPCPSCQGATEYAISHFGCLFAD